MLCFVLCFVLLPQITVLAQPVIDPAWVGAGSYRILIEVAPKNIGERKSDVMPADVALNLANILSKAGAEGRADLCSLQVIRYDPSTGKALPYQEGYIYARGPNDCPFRWYDAAIPYDFPQILGSITRMNGEMVRTNKLRGGYFYNTLGNWNAGRLAWAHTQDGNNPSYYGIYFDPLPKGRELSQAPPRGWIGDAMPRADREGSSTTGSYQIIVAVDDWNDDGLMDIVYGEQYGCILVFPNRGTKHKPEFPYQQLILDANGAPIDLGLHSSPLIADWDGDGVKDLLAGVYENHIVWFRNEGSNRVRKLTYKGYVKADGSDLELPIRPVIGRPDTLFDQDYYPVIEWADWNGDGRRDLLAGGYITGRIYFYENIGRATDGTPLLGFRGPVEADGKPLNVGDWCAAPCVADFNNDGKPDLIAAGYPMTPESEKRHTLLRYYENVGTKTAPILRERPIPVKGRMPQGSLAVPRACDWNGDGLLDLAVGVVRGDIYLFRNVGGLHQPRFDVGVKPLVGIWGNADIPTRQFLDWNRDGFPDYVEGYRIHLNSGRGNPYRFDKVVSVLPPGVNIEHPTGIGDDWFWPYLCDLDRDGRTDVVFGDWHGNIWFHRNLSLPGARKFDTEGHRLKTTDGREIKVGPIGGDTERDFQALQGARTVFASTDFDRDGLDDLVVGDTYGIVRYYRSAGPKESPVFEPPVQVGNLGVRLLLDTCDWNGDRLMDIVAGTVNHEVYVFLNKGNARFDPPALLRLPPVLEPGAVAVDMNRDGDTDLFLTSTQGSVLVERSFAEHGYASARLLRIERRDRATGAVQAFTAALRE